MVQRTVDALARAGAGDVPLAILPAGTANLLATNLGIPEDLAAAVEIGLHGRRRAIDLGRINGEHFAVMAGAGFDGELIRDADGGLKDRLGRVAYAWTGVRHVRDGAVPMTVTVDGADWYAGAASCVLFGNVGTITGGIRAFDDARPARRPAGGRRGHRRGCAGMGAHPRPDGHRAVRRLAVHQDHVGSEVRVKLAEPLTYEIDGGARARDRQAQGARGALRRHPLPSLGSVSGWGPETDPRVNLGRAP